MLVNEILLFVRLVNIAAHRVASSMQSVNVSLIPTQLAREATSS